MQEQTAIATVPTVRERIGQLVAQERLYTIPEAARQMAVAPDWLKRRVHTGDVLSVQLGRNRRIPAASIVDVITRGLCGKGLGEK